MTEIESQVFASLTELDRAVKSMANANPKPNLLPIFSRLDELAAQLPPETAPELRHYLQRKSYEKALQFLTAPESAV
jgi:hypothetical protein